MILCWNAQVFEPEFDQRFELDKLELINNAAIEANRANDLAHATRGAGHDHIFNIFWHEIHHRQRDNASRRKPDQVCAFAGNPFIDESCYLSGGLIDAERACINALAMLW